MLHGLHSAFVVLVRSALPADLAGQVPDSTIDEAIDGVLGGFPLDRVSSIRLRALSELVAIRVRQATNQETMRVKTTWWAWLAAKMHWPTGVNRAARREAQRYARTRAAGRRKRRQ